MSGIIVEIPWGKEKEVYTTTFGNREPILGQWGMTPDGRVFRWAFSGGAIAAGQSVQSAAAVAADDMDLAVAAAAAVGATTISITTVGAISANYYRDGYAYGNDGAGEGQVYGIRSHPAASAATTLVLTLHETVREALDTATSLVGLVRNRYMDVVTYPGNTGITGTFLGICPVEVTNDDYFWVQQLGPCAWLDDSASAGVVGDGVEPSQSTDGAMHLHDVSGETDQPPAGYLGAIAAVATDYGFVDLTSLR